MSILFTKFSCGPVRIKSCEGMHIRFSCHCSWPARGWRLPQTKGGWESTERHGSPAIDGPVARVRRAARMWKTGKGRHAHRTQGWAETTGPRPDGSSSTIYTWTCSSSYGTTKGTDGIGADRLGGCSDGTKSVRQAHHAADRASKLGRCLTRRRFLLTKIGGGPASMSSTRWRKQRGGRSKLEEVLSSSKGGRWDPEFGMAAAPARSPRGGETPVYDRKGARAERVRLND